MRRRLSDWPATKARQGVGRKYRRIERIRRGRRVWAFIRTYLERDLPQLGINLPAITLRRFWTMLAHYHGQTWNGSELARASPQWRPQ